MRWREPKIGLDTALAKAASIWSSRQSDEDASLQWKAWLKSKKTAGEITDGSAIIWAQTKRPATVNAKANGEAVGTAKAKDGADDTVRLKLKALKPGTRYSYRFCLKSKPKTCSDTGHFTTAPKPGQAKTIRFAYSGDETGASLPGQHNPLWGRFRAFKSMAAEPVESRSQRGARSPPCQCPAHTTANMVR